LFKALPLLYIRNRNWIRVSSSTQWHDYYKATNVGRKEEESPLKWKDTA
jgi:hypothetical protein